MARLPDLVRDSKLETQFLDVETIHTYDECDPSSRGRRVSRLEHWKRQEQIGAGGFGSVWLEKCTKGSRDIEIRAVKRLEIGRHLTHTDYLRELEAVAKFSHSKYERCFIKSFGWYESPQHLYIAMEYLEHGDLYTYLRHKPPLPEEEVREVVRQLLDGLCMMHENQFAHRDLKPSNILLKSCPPNEWWVKITDFGISKRIEEATGRSTTFKGTLGYIAPEIYGFTKEGSPYAVDIWAVGEIAFRMLTKQPTFKHLGLLSNYMTKPEAFPSGVLLAVQTSQLGVQFIISHMQPNPENRITAENALLHKWIVQSLPCRLVPVTSAPDKEGSSLSPIESITEGFAAWDTITPQQGILIPRRAEELMSGKEAVKVQPLDGSSKGPVPPAASLNPALKRTNTGPETQPKGSPPANLNPALKGSNTRPESPPREPPPANLNPAPKESSVPPDGPVKSPPAKNGVQSKNQKVDGPVNTKSTESKNPVVDLDLELDSDYEEILGDIEENAGQLERLATIMHDLIKKKEKLETELEESRAQVASLTSSLDQKSLRM